MFQTFFLKNYTKWNNLQISCRKFHNTDDWLLKTHHPGNKFETMNREYNNRLWRKLMGHRISILMILIVVHKLFMGLLSGIPLSVSDPKTRIMTGHQLEVKFIIYRR